MTGIAVDAPEPSAVAPAHAEVPMDRDARDTGAFTPSVPRLVLRVGVTGHRPNRLPPNCASLEETVTRLLQQIRTVANGLVRDSGGVYADGAPVLRVISPLAEGSDRIVARCALASGYELQSPLPFAREEYEHDFHDAASRAEFAQLIARASAVLELDGARASASAAYEQVGRVMLAQSDVVIAVWNGDSESGRGGTAQVVREAQGIGIPVLWIEPDRPTECQAMRTAPDGIVITCCADGELEQIVRQILAVDVEPDSAVERAYFSDPHGRGRPLGLFTIFRSLILGATRPRRRPARRSDPLARRLPTVPTSLQREYAWADDLATHYGRCYRDSFVANYLMGAAAVVTALLGYRAAWAVVAEFVLITAIIVVTRRAQREAWHGRWLSYRLLAEQLRQAELLYPVGYDLPSFRVAAHAATGDPSRLWVSWLARARVRELGMPNARIDAAYGRAYRRLLQSRLVEQVRYHRDSAKVNGTLAHRLHRTGLAIFAAALVACSLHLLLDALETPFGDRLVHFRADTLDATVRPAGALLTFLSAVLPALGAALAAISSQAEFGRVRDRSSAMVPRLLSLLARLRSPSITTTATSGRIAVEAAEVMTAELLDWQITFRDKPLDLPA